ncbi:protein TolA [Chromatium weissei]|nr:protein TolA [Chromatium weissei]
MWRFLRFQRFNLRWSLALHLMLGAVLLINAHFTPPKTPSDQQLRVVKARLVEIPSTPLLQREAIPQQHIEQQHQAAEIARIEAARRDAEAAAAQRLAVEQQRQATAFAKREAERQRRIAEEAEQRAAAERQAEIERQAQIAQAAAMQRQQAEAEEAARVAAEHEQHIEQQRQAVEIARLETEREPNREAELLAALAAEELGLEVGRYTPAIQDRIRQFWILPLASNRNLAAVVSVRLIPGGDVVPDSARIVQSSGNAAFDQSVLAAVYQASPLPVPAGAAFEHFRNFDFTFSAE